MVKTLAVLVRRFRVSIAESIGAGCIVVALAQWDARAGLGAAGVAALLKGLEWDLTGSSDDDHEVDA